MLIKASQKVLCWLVIILFYFYFKVVGFWHEIDMIQTFSFLGNCFYLLAWPCFLYFVQLISTIISNWTNFLWTLFCPVNSHKTRLHIGQLVKDTSAKLKQASETDHEYNVSVSLFSNSSSWNAFPSASLRPTFNTLLWFMWSFVLKLLPYLHNLV